MPSRDRLQAGQYLVDCLLVSGVAPRILCKSHLGRHSETYRAYVPSQMQSALLAISADHLWLGDAFENTEHVGLSHSVETLFCQGQQSLVVEIEL